MKKLDTIADIVGVFVDCPSFSKFAGGLVPVSEFCFKCPSFAGVDGMKILCDYEEETDSKQCENGDER